VRITRIESQKRRPGRKNIYVDGAFFTAASDETLLRLGLRPGEELTPELLDRLFRTESRLTTKAAALRLLAVRPRSVRELRDRLRTKNLPPEEIEAVITDLERAALLDDRAFARSYIRDRTVLKAAGPSLLRERLLRLGVPRPILEEVMTEELSALDLDLLARRAAEAYLRKHAPRGHSRSDAGLRRRAAAHLTRRGFDWETISRVLKRALSDEPGGEDE